MNEHLYAFLRKLPLLLICMMCGMGMTYAQKTITGTVTDNNGEPLIGANILVKGTSNGTITDIDGNFTISAADSDVLVISYTGYQTTEVAVGGQSNVSVVLSVGQVLDEIVVTGYGTTKRSDVTGSVASLNSDKFNKGIFTAPDQLLQGRMAGVYVVNNSGQPGGQTTVKIRGNNSIRAGADPLYVVDGVPLDGRSARAGLISTDIGAIPSSNPLNFLNPADIASISVLKDASAAAIFGSRAANGVVQVTTKRATSTVPVIDFGFSLGASSILKKYDVLNGDEYRAALTDYGISGDGGSDVDALDEILHTGVTQNYALSVGGSTEDSRYRLSFGLSSIDGIVRESGIKKYNAGFNTGFDFMDDKVGLDVYFIANHATEDIAPISTNAGFTGNLVAQALHWNPTIPLIQNGEFSSATNNSTGAVIGATTINPLALLAAHDERANTTTLLGSISPFVNITDNIQYRYRYGVNYGRGFTRGNVRGWINVQGIENEGFAAISNAQLISQLHTHTINWDNELSSTVNLGVLVGYEYQKFDFRGEAFAGRGFSVLDRDNTPNLQNSEANQRLVFSYADPVSELQSVFGRVNLDMSDKYFLTATIRADGSSKFGENNQYGYFPSVAFLWKLSNEAFLQDGFFDDLRFRIGWGQTGNQEFPAGAAQDRFTLIAGGVQQENVGNPNLKWETSATFNVGLEFGFLDYKVTGILEYFNRKTTDLLLDPLVSEPGPAVRAWRNIDGEVVNSGVEASINAFLIQKANLGLQLGLNASILNNVLQNYNGPDLQVGELFGQGTSNATSQIMRDGESLNTFYTREFLGLDDNGVSMYAEDGNEFFLFGDPNADLILGASLNLDISKFSAGLNFNGAFGHQIYNNTAMSVIPIGNLGTRNIDANLIGGPVRENLANAIAPSSRYIEDGDFIKLANATLAYNIGDVRSVKNVRVSLTGQNLLVITDYTGFDPEVNTVNLRNGIPSNGIEYIPYPSARSFLVSLSCSF